MLFMDDQRNEGNLKNKSHAQANGEKKVSKMKQQTKMINSSVINIRYRLPPLHWCVTIPSKVHRRSRASGKLLKSIKRQLYLHLHPKTPSTHPDVSQLRVWNQWPWAWARRGASWCIKPYEIVVCVSLYETLVKVHTTRVIWLHNPIKSAQAVLHVPAWLELLSHLKPAFKYGNFSAELLSWLSLEQTSGHSPCQLGSCNPVLHRRHQLSDIRENLPTCDQEDWPSWTWCPSSEVMESTTRATHQTFLETVLCSCSFMSGSMGVLYWFLSVRRWGCSTG